MKVPLLNVNLILKLTALKNATVNLGFQVMEENLSTLVVFVNTFAPNMDFVGPEKITKVVLTVGSVK